MAKKAKGKKKKGKTARAARPAKPKRKTAAKGKKGPAKPKRKVKAPAKKMPAPAAPETAKLREEVKRWQMLHGQLQEQIKTKDSTIAQQMKEIIELKKNLEQLTQPSQLEL